MRGGFRGGYRGGYGGPGPMGPGRPGFMGPGPHGPQNGPGSRGSFPSRPPPFDLAIADEFFPRINGSDDTALTQEIVNRADKLAPSEVERGHLSMALTKTTTVLSKIKSDPTLLPAVQIEEFVEVGSSKKDTMLAGHKTIDIVVVLKSMPTVEAVHSLGQKISTLLRAEKETVSVQNRDFGALLVFSSTGVKVQLLISTVAGNKQHLEEDLHVSEKYILRHVKAIRHARWFYEAAAGSPVKDLVRVFKDIRNRFPDLKPLNIWTIEFLCHFSMVNTSNRQPLALGPAFRRFLQLLAAGVFLPGSIGLLDPCDVPSNFLSSLTFEEMDKVCSTAQTLVRILGHGGQGQVLGTAPEKCDFSKGPWYFTVDNKKIVVAPLEKAYVEEEMASVFEAPAKA